MSQLHQDIGETTSLQQIQDQGLNSTSSTAVSSTFLDKQQQIQQIQKIEVTSPTTQNNTQELQQNQMRNFTLSLICEDRLTSKKCCFPNIQIELANLTDKVNVFTLLNTSLSVQAFLKGHLIFIESEGMDIALGLFPFEMDKNYEAVLSLIQDKYQLKLNHQKVASHSDSYRQKSSSNASDTANKAHQLRSIQGIQIKKRQTDSLQIESNQNYSNLCPEDTKQEYNQIRRISSANSSYNIYSSHSSEIQTHSSSNENNQLEEEEEGCNGQMPLGKHKRNRTSNTSSSEKIPLSYSQNEIDEDKGIETEDNQDGDDIEEGCSGSQSSKNSQILKKGIKKEKSQMYRSISSIIKKNITQKIKGEHIVANSQENQENQSESAPKKRRRQTLNKRSHERTIREGILLVTQWRNNHEYYKTKNQMKDLQEVAKDMGISKKTLDYYYLELRTAEFFDFDFDSHLNQRMGFLRQFIEDKTKEFQNLNKQAKIPRQLNFKYRLPEHRGNHNSDVNSISSNNNSIGIQILQSQSANHIYLQKDTLPQSSHQIMIPHTNSNHHQNQPNYQNHHHHHHHYASHIQSQNQANIPIISQQQKINQIFQQQQIQLGNSNNSISNNQISQIDANSTSSLSIFNQSTRAEGSLNQSDHNFMNSSATIHHYSSPHQSNSIQSQNQQIFHNQNVQVVNNSDQRSNAQQVRIDPSLNQIVDYQIQNNRNNRNLINQDRNPYQNYNLQQTSSVSHEEQKPTFFNSEQQYSGNNEQMNSNLIPPQPTQIGRFMSGQLLTLPSTQSISDSNHNLQYQHSHPRPHSQQNIKQNPELRHPYEEKQQNEGYKQFLDKQKQQKLQEMIEERPIQNIFE